MVYAFIIYWFIGCFLVASGYARHLKPQMIKFDMKEKDFEDPDDAFNAQVVFFEILIWPYAVMLLIMLAPTYIRLAKEAKENKETKKM